MKLLICGDRNWTDREMIRAKLNSFRSFNGTDHEVLHGDCRGADRMAAAEAKAMGFRVLAFPAMWSLYGRAAGPARNRAMLGEGAQLVWAFHDNLRASKGTADMVKAARLSGVKVVHFTHDIEESGRAPAGGPTP